MATRRYEDLLSSRIKIEQMKIQKSWNYPSDFASNDICKRKREEKLKRNSHKC
ncbi:hypothetical protein AXX17_AT5G29200 [Arabidopsis thaliana]|uniref:Uncharacterized protein n=1 Tax=Arabidopsis thaliana TaxID=3702 RepID=A0A178US79_ARATH|nr:hypothetical protein AXX17_AT5G29200 [Arabidopsis thaliana]